jgi:hypothetical protein
MECRASGRIPRLRYNLWPRQTEPGERYQKAWKELLQMFCKDGSNKLTVPLGRWIKELTRKQWPAMFNTQRGTAAIFKDGAFTEYNLEQQDRRFCKVTSPTGNPCEAMSKMVPAKSWSINKVITIQVPIPTAIPLAIQCDKSSPWHEMIATLPHWQQELLAGSGKNHMDQRVDGLKTLLQEPNGKLTMVSDGGCRDKVGSYGFVLANARTGERLWKASGHLRIQGGSKRYARIPVATPHFCVVPL